MKKILYIINVDWFFISHFLPVGLEGIKRGVTGIFHSYNYTPKVKFEY